MKFILFGILSALLLDLYYTVFFAPMPFRCIRYFSVNEVQIKALLELNILLMTAHFSRPTSHNNIKLHATTVTCYM